MKISFDGQMVTENVLFTMGEESRKLLQTTASVLASVQNFRRPASLQVPESTSFPGKLEMLQITASSKDQRNRNSFDQISNNLRLPMFG